jgi:hypothetical protein
MGSKLFGRNGQAAEEDQFSDKTMMLLKNSVQLKVIGRQKRQNDDDVTQTVLCFLGTRRNFRAIELRSSEWVGAFL